MQVFKVVSFTCLVPIYVSCGSAGLTAFKLSTLWRLCTRSPSKEFFTIDHWRLFYRCVSLFSREREREREVLKIKLIILFVFFILPLYLLRPCYLCCLRSGSCHTPNNSDEFVSSVVYRAGLTFSLLVSCTRWHDGWSMNQCLVDLTWSFLAVFSG